MQVSSVNLYLYYVLDTVKLLTSTWSVIKIPASQRALHSSAMKIREAQYWLLIISMVLRLVVTDNTDIADESKQAR